MPRYVCDTSVLVKWFSERDETHLVQARALFDDWKGGQASLVTCDLAVWELANALHKGKRLPLEEVRGALAGLFDLPLKLRPPHRELAEATADIAAEYGLTSYDACFLALAKMEACQLITDNPRHHGRVTDGSVLLLEDYQMPIPSNTSQD